MSKYYYVKSGYGTNTGATPFSSKQIGAFSSLNASDCYDSLDALPSLSVNDVVFISHLHNKIYATATSFNITGGDGFTYLFSVDDSACEKYKKGAHEEVTNGKFTINNQLVRDHYNICGISFKAKNGDLVIDSYHALSTIEDCTLYASGRINLSGKSKQGIVRNSDITCSHLLAVNSNIEFIGGSISASSHIIDAVTGASFSFVDFRGSADGIYLIKGSSLVSAYSYKFYRCMLPTNYQARKNDTYSYIYDLSIIACDDYFSFAHYQKFSVIRSTTDTKLNYNYDDTNKLSVEINTLAEISTSRPLTYKLCEIPGQDLSSSNKTYRVNLLLDTSTYNQLTNENCWLDVVHDSNADLALGKIVSSRNSDFLSSGVELAVSDEQWTGTLPDSNKAYHIDIELLSSELSYVKNSSVVVYINIAVPNADIYVCPAVLVGS